MKKIMTLALAAVMVTGSAFAHEGKCAKGKETCHKETKECCKKDKAAKAAKTTTVTSKKS